MTSAGAFCLRSSVSLPVLRPCRGDHCRAGGAGTGCLGPAGRAGGQFCRPWLHGHIVGRRSVVTAAHCLPPNEKAVVAFLRDQKPVAFSTVIHSARHPGLVRPIPARPRRWMWPCWFWRICRRPVFTPARIAASDANKGQTVTIAGFGRMRMNDMSADGRLRRVSLPVIERSVSGYLLIGHPDGAERQANPSACQGDSGGPVFLNGALAGVLSLVAGENDRMGCGYLTVAMPVPSIAGWIRGEIARGEMIQNGALKRPACRRVASVAPCPRRSKPRP